MKKKCDELLEVGYIYRNPSSKWACAPLIAPKEGPEKFRFTADLRPVNAQSKKNMRPMPHADPMLAKTIGAKTFFQLDFTHRQWQFPLAKDSQECKSFHTPFGVFTPKRVLYGATNSVSCFQSTMEALFSDLKLLIRLYDVLRYAEDAETLIDTLKWVLTICREKGLKLNPRKCHLMATNVQFCGRMIDAKGVPFHTRYWEALMSMKAPTTVAPSWNSNTARTG